MLINTATGYGVDWAVISGVSNLLLRFLQSYESLAHVKIRSMRSLCGISGAVSKPAVPRLV